MYNSRPAGKNANRKRKGGRNMKIKAALLLCLMSAAVLALCGAWRSLHRIGGPALPEEVAARFVGREEGAEFFLRESGGYVAVFGGRRSREPMRVTPIEAEHLRETDRLLLREGIPAHDSGELLHLLEDLGS
jgi:hypothetical protein